jgi:hypothetical protein
MRQRASIVLTGGGIAASVIGQHGLDKDIPKLWAAAAMAVTIAGADAGQGHRRKGHRRRRIAEGVERHPQHRPGGRGLG